MNEAFAIQADLEVNLTGFDFALDEEKKLNNVSIRTDTDLDLATMNEIVAVLDAYLSGYRLAVNLDQVSIRATIR